MENSPNKKHQDFSKTWGEIVRRAWKDEVFKQKLKNNPKEVFKEYGVEVPSAVKNIHIHENSRESIHLSIPSQPNQNLSEKDLEKVAAGMIKWLA